MSKSPMESLLNDKMIMANLKTLDHIPSTTLRLRSVPPLEDLHATINHIENSQGLEGAGPMVAEGTGLEAIVLAFGRPTLLIQDNTFAVPELPEWRLRLEPVRTGIDRIIPSIGRIEIKRLPDDMHLGTGWLLTEDIIVTNRHVAAFFSNGSGRTATMAKDPFDRNLKAQIDFREEHARSEAVEHEVVEIVWVEQFDPNLPDMALLKIKRNNFLPPPIELLATLPKPDEAVIAVIGYPAWDYRNDASVMARIFGDIYGVKRLAPGFVTGADENFIFQHDCTTLGGNSGSVIIDTTTGKAVGLHYAGEFGVCNYAVCAQKIQERLSDLNIQVQVPASYARLSDLQAEPSQEAVVPPETYADRNGYQRQFVPGTPVIEPGFDAIADDLTTLADGSGTELKYTHFSVWMNRQRRLAICAAVNIDGTRLKRFSRRRDKWLHDSRIDQSLQIGNELYKHNKLDRGHLVRRLDPVWGDEEEARKAMEDTFHYTNAAPQHKGLNQVTWLELEDYILDNASAHELKLTVFTGPVFKTGDRSYREVDLPEEFWKIVVMSRCSDDGNASPVATAYLLSQTDLLSNIEFAFGPYRTWQVPVRMIEARTRIDFSALYAYDPMETAGLQEAMVRPQEINNWQDIVIEASAPETGDLAPSPGLTRICNTIRKVQRSFSLDYIVEFADHPPVDLMSRIESVLPATALTENVFAQDPRFVRIKFPGALASQVDLNPFELVEPLLKALEAEGVEPDLSTDYFLQEPETGLESTKEFGCWVGNSEQPPNDYAWALRKMKVPDAWAYSQKQGRPSQGDGILIAQPDTGITDHSELNEAMDETRWADLLNGGKPFDPLESNDPFDNPGHGTGTGSVVISRGTVEEETTGAPGSVTGSAPKARLVPIRCIESVIRITQSRVARAIEHAVESGCHVITMSLGGLWSRSLASAVHKAIDNNLIVLAAAGNCVKTVVWPARYKRCIAVAGSNLHDKTWKGSCRGPAVDISAPAQHVYRASRKKEDAEPNKFGPGEGTSFAVALTAGVAAMWLAHHGRENLINSLASGERLQDRFIRLAQENATIPEGWDHGKYGAGVVNADELLKAGLGEQNGGFEAMKAFRTESPLDSEVADAAGELFAEFTGNDEEAPVNKALFQHHGLELIWLTFENRKTEAGLEAASMIRPSDALLQELSKPENNKIARAIGFDA